MLQNQWFIADSAAPTSTVGGLGGRRRGLVDQVGLGFVLDHRLVDHDLADVLQRGQLVHGVQQDRLDDGAQAAGAGLALERLARDRGQGVGAELQFHAFHVEQLPELLADRVARLGQDLDQGGLVELLEGGDHRQAADELGDQAELDQVLGLDLGQDLADLELALGALELGAEADAAGVGAALLDDLVQAGERAADDEQDVAGVDLQELLLRVLAPALRRHAGHGALDQLEQRLLHAFAGHVAGDRRVLALARDLVDLVDVDDALLRLVDIIVALLQQLLDDVLDVLADVAGFGQRRGVGHGERHVQQARQGLGQERLARAGRPDQEDVGLGQFDVVVLLPALDPLVVVVHGHGERLLRALLADHVLVEDLEDLARLGQAAAGRLRLLLEFLADDVVAQLDAFIADEHARARDQLADLVLALPAERAVEDLAAVAGSALSVFGHSPVTCCRRGCGPRIALKWPGWSLPGGAPGPGRSGRIPVRPRRS